ncbi:unnamed protein product [Sphagnum balticum]
MGSSHMTALGCSLVHPVNTGSAGIDSVGYSHITQPPVDVRRIYRAHRPIAWICHDTDNDTRRQQLLLRNELERQKYVLSCNIKTTDNNPCRQDWLNERKQLQQQLVDARLTASQPRLDVSELQTTIDELRRSLQREEAEKEELQLQLATHSNRVDTYDPAANPICIQNEFASENAELRAKLDELRRDFEGLTERYRVCSEQLADHRDQYTDKETQLRKVEAELQALRERDRNESSSEGKSKEEMSRLEKEITTLKTERDGMHEALTVCQRDKSQLETDLRKTHDQLREMHDQLDEVGMERDGLRTALLTLEKDGNSMRQQLDELNREHEVLIAEKQQLHTTFEEERINLKQSYESEIDRLTLEKERLENELQRVKAKQEENLSK